MYGKQSGKKIGMKQNQRKQLLQLSGEIREIRIDDDGRKYV